MRTKSKPMGLKEANSILFVLHKIIQQLDIKESELMSINRSLSDLQYYIKRENITRERNRNSNLKKKSEDKNAK